MLRLRENPSKSLSELGDEPAEGVAPLGVDPLGDGARLLPGEGPDAVGEIERLFR
jgi:hypothetical protein